MNKEIIKKYKKEFNWWLKGGKLMAADSSEPKITWLSLEPSWTNSNAIYVINDDYVELRKALAEGKIIQEQIGSPNTGLKWIDMLGKKFHKHISCYRIKLDNHKFKIGDWVKRIGYSNIFRVNAIENGFLHSDTSEHYLIENMELWKPQQGDWCWFWNSGISKSNPQLRQFKYMNNKNAYVTFNGEAWKYCEPFKGVLPTVLQK